YSALAGTPDLACSMMRWSCGASPSHLACCVHLCSNCQPWWCISCSVWMNSSRCPLSTSTIDGILGSRTSLGISHQKNARNSKPENGEGNKEFLGGRLVQKQKEESAMTQRERIASGKLFTDMSEGLPEERLRGKQRMYEFNHTKPTEMARRLELM